MSFQGSKLEGVGKGEKSKICANNDNPDPKEKCFNPADTGTIFCATCLQIQQSSLPPVEGAPDDNNHLLTEKEA